MSDKVIHNCISSIPRDIKIIIVDNSNNKSFKHEIEKKYNNVRCILSEKNLGMGAGNNIGILNVADIQIMIIIKKGSLNLKRI